MVTRHVAFVVEPVYGHIIPTLGIATELLSRGYRVSYAVTKRFSGKLQGIGVEPKIYQPLENKLKLFNEIKMHGIDFFSESCAQLWGTLRKEETDDSLKQLRDLYDDDRPDVVVYDFMNPAGKLFGVEIQSRTVEHNPVVVTRKDPLNPNWPYDDKLVITSIPRFFQRNADDLDKRFEFVGFIPNARARFFQPWASRKVVDRVILISATTGLLPQSDFFRLAISAFADSAFRIVLSIGEEMALSELGPLPANCEINRCSGNFEILEKAALFIGQAGQGSILESFYHAVPQILVPPSPLHNDLALRVTELGLGVRLRESEATVTNIHKAGMALLHDDLMRTRLEQVSKTMREEKAAERAANLITQSLV
jgi:UDP:flavonoid glycosyltransferase YjiC (YdhE family)